MQSALFYMYDSVLRMLLVTKLMFRLCMINYYYFHCVANYLLDKTIIIFTIRKTYNTAIIVSNLFCLFRFKTYVEIYDPKKFTLNIL